MDPVEVRKVVAGAEAENNVVGLRSAIRDLEEAALQDLSAVQRSALEDRLSGESLADAMDAEAKAVRKIFVAGEIRSDDEWRLAEAWLQHEETAHEIAFESRSYGEQVEMLETLMMKYIQDHGNPDGRHRGENAGK